MFLQLAPIFMFLTIVIICGCDIGKAGALVVLDKEGEFVDFLSYPLLKNREYDVHTLGANLVRLIQKYSSSPSIVTIEHVSARSTDSRTMICSFGGAYGMMKGFFGMLNLPFQCVHPLKWMREFKLFGKGKEGSIKLANEVVKLPPHLGSLDGVTDATLLALWGKQHLEKYGGYPQKEEI